mgnify:CR=1 FL=1
MVIKSFLLKQNGTLICREVFSSTDLVSVEQHRGDWVRSVLLLWLKSVEHASDEAIPVGNYSTPVNS